MLDRIDIKDGTIVFDRGTNNYGILADVGNAQEKGDRMVSPSNKDELSYSIIDVLTKCKIEGMCERSHMTSAQLSVASKRDVEIYLATLGADESLIISHANRKVVEIQEAVNEFSKLDTIWNFK